MRISVAMATYNGGCFLREQLDSLAAQTLAPTELVICDDLSDDETERIVSDFAKCAHFPVRFFRNTTRLGAADNFLQAVSHCSGEWIAFADQDDVWFPNKLARIEQEVKRDPDLSLIVHSADVVDSHLAPNGRRVPDFRRDRTAPPLTNPIQGSLPGFAMTFHIRLLQGLAPEKRPIHHEDRSRRQTHDHFVYFLADSFGKIRYLKESLAYYRRHEKSLTGSFNRVDLQEMSKKASRINADAHAALGALAGDFSEFLSQSIPPLGSPQSAQAGRAVSRYRKWAHILSRRADLHRDGASRRVAAYFDIARAGAYSPRARGGLGLKGFAKDTATLVLGRRGLERVLAGFAAAGRKPSRGR